MRAVSPRVARMGAACGDMWIGRRCRVTMDDGTEIVGTPDAYAAGRLYFGWVTLPIMQVNDIQEEHHD